MRCQGCDRQDVSGGGGGNQVPGLSSLELVTHTALSAGWKAVDTRTDAVYSCPKEPLWRMSPSEMQRARSHNAVERAGKVAVIVEPGVQGNLGHLVVRLDQQTTGSVDPHVEEVFARAGAEEPVEQPVELAAREAGLRGKLNDGQRLGIAIMDHLN